MLKEWPKEAAKGFYEDRALNNVDIFRLVKEKKPGLPVLWVLYSKHVEITKTLSTFTMLFDKKCRENFPFFYITAEQHNLI